MEPFHVAQHFFVHHEFREAEQVEVGQVAGGMGQDAGVGQGHGQGAQGAFYAGLVVVGEAVGQGAGAADGDAVVIAHGDVPGHDHQEFGCAGHQPDFTHIGYG